ncbi:MAG: PEP/pyruvate-binding domain-containing protein, partial [Polyangia bacterium]
MNHVETGTQPPPARREAPRVPGVIAWFDELSRAEVATAGGKGANLGELARAGLPVPPGFVVTAPAYLAAMDAGSARSSLRNLAGSVDADTPHALSAAACTARGLVHKAGVPAALRDAVIDAYHRLGANTSVAVRSSATMEDAAGSSFAGMNESFTNIVGDDALVDAVVRCWMSAWAERVLAYRSSRGLDDEPAIAVVVQRMVASERSGVLFTADPTTGDRERIVIEAAFGLGEVVVGGQVEPDTYTLSKSDGAPLSTRIGIKAHKIIRGADGHDARVELVGDEQSRRVLDEGELARLHALALQIERHYGSPQDVEWAIEGGEIFIVQSRPITTLGGAAAELPTAGEVLVSGLGAAPGVASGAVRVLHSVADAARLQKGDVLVAPMTTPDWVPVLRRAAALVTDQGGMTCHAAIVSRELRIPCVVGTGNATTRLADGAVVTVDGSRARVYAGRVHPAMPAPETATTATATATAPAAAPAVEPLGTRIYVNLAIAERAEEV